METEAQSGKVTTTDSVCNCDLGVTDTTPTDSETMETSSAIAEHVRPGDLGHSVTREFTRDCIKWRCPDVRGSSRDHSAVLLRKTQTFISRYILRSPSSPPSALGAGEEKTKNRLALVNCSGYGIIFHICILCLWYDTTYKMCVLD